MTAVVGVSQGSYVAVAGNLRGSSVVVILDSDDPSTCNICSHFNTFLMHVLT